MPLTGAKPWYTSKTVWTAIITGLIGTYMQVNVAMDYALPEIPGVVITILGALGLYGRAVAKKEIKK